MRTKQTPTLLKSTELDYKWDDLYSLFEAQPVNVSSDCVEKLLKSVLKPKQMKYTDRAKAKLVEACNTFVTEHFLHLGMAHYDNHFDQVCIGGRKLGVRFHDNESVRADSSTSSPSLLPQFDPHAVYPLWNNKDDDSGCETSN